MARWTASGLPGWTGQNSRILGNGQASRMRLVTFRSPVCSCFDVLPLMHPGGQTSWLPLTSCTQDPRLPSSPALPLCPRHLIPEWLVDVCLWGPHSSIRPNMPQHLLGFPLRQGASQGDRVPGSASHFLHLRSDGDTALQPSVCSSCCLCPSTPFCRHIPLVTEMGAGLKNRLSHISRPVLSVRIFHMGWAPVASAPTSPPLGPLCHTPLVAPSLISINVCLIHTFVF